MIGNRYHIKLKDNTELVGIPTVGSVGTDLTSATFTLTEDNGKFRLISFKSVLEAKQI